MQLISAMGRISATKAGKGKSWEDATNGETLELLCLLGLPWTEVQLGQEQGISEMHSRRRLGGILACVLICLCLVDLRKSQGVGRGRFGVWGAVSASGTGPTHSTTVAIAVMVLYCCTALVPNNREGLSILQVGEMLVCKPRELAGQFGTSIL